MVQEAASIIDIVAFVTTVRSGSFAAAGVRLGRSRSAIAKAVMRLEERLGTRLLTRSTRRIALTEDGQRFHARCAALLDDLEAAEADVAQNTDRPRGVLRVAAPEAFGETFVAPLIAQYLGLYPEMQVEMRFSDRVGSLIERGDDIALRVGLTDRLPPDLVSRVVGRIEHRFYASAGYLAARGTPRTMDDLETHDAIPFNSGDRLRRWRVLGEYGVWLEMPNGSRVSADSSQGVMAAAVQGLGIAYLPVIIAQAQVASGGLVELPITSGRVGLPVVALYQSRRNLPAKVRAFLDLLKPSSTYSEKNDSR